LPTTLSALPLPVFSVNWAGHIFLPLSFRMAKRSRSSQRKAGWVGYRSKHRQRSHDAAHDGVVDAEHPAILDHPDVAGDDLRIISTRDGLKQLIADIRSIGRFGYDTEFIGEQTYHPQICLIQVGTPEFIALIDPFEDVDLTSFWELIADPAIETIVHAGQQDLEPVPRLIGKLPANIFDVQIAAAFAGLSYPSSLSRLVHDLLNVELGLGTKFSQWDNRPLSPMQKRYASNDVRYLPLMHTLLVEKLTELGNLEWCHEECATLCDRSLYEFNVSAQRRRMKGIDTLSAREDAALRRLLKWRDDAAREFDAPPRALVKDDVLLTIARTLPQDHAALHQIRGLPRPIKKRYGQELLDLISDALADPITERARSPLANVNRRFDREREEINRLWEIVRAKSVARSIDPAIVTSKKELGRLARQMLYVGDGAPTLMPPLRIDEGWRRELLGDLRHADAATDENQSDDREQ
jgi:ribonuclease D